MKLADFRVLTFDCYGTLIDWESGLLTALVPLRARAALALSDEQVLETFALHEAAHQEVIHMSGQRETRRSRAKEP